MIEVTEAQKRVLDILCTTGESDRYIANELDLSVATVKMHLTEIKRYIKFQTGIVTKNRLQMVLVLLRNGYESRKKLH